MGVVMRWLFALSARQWFLLGFLFCAGLMLAAFYLGGLYSGLLILKVFSFLPLIYLILFYYLNRKDFLKLVPVIR